MIAIRTYAALLIVLATAACETRSPAPAASFSRDEGAIVHNGVTLPRLAAGLVRGPQVDFEKAQPGLGSAFKYASETAFADVYVYDRKMTSIPDDPQSPILRRELMIAVEEIQELVRAGRYASASPPRIFMGGARGKPEFVAAQLVLVRGSDPFDSYVFVGARTGKFLKIRYSTPADSGSAEQAGRFAQAIFGQR